MQAFNQEWSSVPPDESQSQEEAVQIESNMAKSGTNKPKTPTKASDVSPGDVRRMMSTPSGRQALQKSLKTQVQFRDTDNNCTFYKLNVTKLEYVSPKRTKLYAVEYNMTNARTEESMSLAGGGCNETCVNNKTWRIIFIIPNRRVNITGLENNQVNGNELCSAGCSSSDRCLFVFSNLHWSYVQKSRSSCM